MKLRRDGGPPLCIGHRGAAALAPANSRAAIEAAFEAGVDVVEIDVVGISGRGLLLTHSARELAAEPLVLDDALSLIAPSDADVLRDVKNEGHERELVGTVNDAMLAGRLVKMGVDGVITDNPAICRATLQA